MGVTRKTGKDGKRLVLTGGHAATMAISVVEEILRRGINTTISEIYWLGSAQAVEGKNVPTLESIVLPKLGVNYYPIVAGRIQMKFSRWTIPSLLKIPLGFIDALRLLVKIKPDVILSFGGFSAFPVVVIGRLLSIPILLHEQTATVGRANKYSAVFANKIALARESSLPFFPRSKCTVVGNPILTQIAEILPKDKIGNPPVVYITGGSRGSLTINKAVEGSLSELLGTYRVIHNAGRIDFDRFKKIKAGLPPALNNRYEVYPFIDPMKIDNIFREADILVSRTGAATVAEIMATKRPAVLIPIPWAYHQETQANAKLACDMGLARVLPQNKLNSWRLLKEVGMIYKNWEQMVKKAKDFISPDVAASQKLVDLIEEQLK